MSQDSVYSFYAADSFSILLNMYLLPSINEMQIIFTQVKNLIVQFSQVPLGVRLDTLSAHMHTGCNSNQDCSVFYSVLVNLTLIFQFVAWRTLFSLKGPLKYKNQKPNMVKPCRSF